MKCIKKVITFIFLFLIVISSSSAKELEVDKHMENVIMLDVARRYFTVDQIKEYIDLLSLNENSTLQIHFTDDENVGIECTYLNQTKASAIENNGVYINPVTNKPFLTYDQVTEIMNYARSKNVRFIPEIDMPAHMYGFFELAINKFGEDFVKHPYDWDNQENSGIAWKNDSEKGNIDLMSPNSKPFIYNLLDEYTLFFKDNEYFSIGFDEYTLRPELKVEFINELYTYLSNKGFKVRMWSDPITKDNISSINNKIEINYWGWKEEDILTTDYATVKDLQDNDFKVIISNKYYLFFVPHPFYMDDESLSHTVDNIINEWTIDKWNYNYESSLDTYDNILGAMMCIWNEDSDQVAAGDIFNHAKNMYNAMVLKLPIGKTIVNVDDDKENEIVSETVVEDIITNTVSNNTKTTTVDVENPGTGSHALSEISLLFCLTFFTFISLTIYKKKLG